MKKLKKIKDEEIIEIVRSEDKEAYSEIIKRYEKKLLRYANYLVKDEHDAADIVQESFIKAYVKIKSFNKRKSFSSWIYRIVHNEAMNLVKREKRKVKIDEKMEFDSGVDIEEDLIRKELKLDTRNYLDQIPVKYCEPLSLFYLEDKSYEQISDILRIPVGTVGTRINRAKKILQKICQK
ncbi:RNA polymerase sigma factor [Candidatus Woesebacteria bacterium]|nr:RNA polymerase sigma factor [Candidatus Woesebacteria bacterium]